MSTTIRPGGNRKDASWGKRERSFRAKSERNGRLGALAPHLPHSASAASGLLNLVFEIKTPMQWPHASLQCGLRRLLENLKHLQGIHVELQGVLTTLIPLPGLDLSERMAFRFLEFTRRSGAFPIWRRLARFMRDQLPGPSPVPGGRAGSPPSLCLLLSG